jgi:hypothetical protein
VFGAPYYWNAGYWFPAWGYYPNAYYAWDGPIYAYNDLPPDQVIANVQTALHNKVIIRVKWTVLLDRLRARQSPVTNATTDSTRHRQSINRPLES